MNTSAGISIHIVDQGDQYADGPIRFQGFRGKVTDTRKAAGGSVPCSHRPGGKAGRHTKSCTNAVTLQGAKAAVFA